MPGTLWILWSHFRKRVDPEDISDPSVSRTTAVRAALFLVVENQRGCQCPADREAASSPGVTDRSSHSLPA